LLRDGEEGRVEIVYGAGWDPSRQRLVGVLTADRARRRDRSGDQYSVLVVSGAGPRLLIDVCWQRWYLAVWVFDPARRRSGKFDFRRLEDERVFLARTEGWRYADGHAEFDARAWHRTADIGLDGRASIEVRYAAEKGGGGSDGEQFDVDALWRPAPAFGDWALLYELAADGVDDEPVSAAMIESVVDRSTPASLARPPWRPPSPLQAPDMTGWFSDGARFQVPHGGNGTVRTRRVGPLRLPTGRLVAAEPSYSSDDFVAFSATVPPGRYPVTLAGFEWDGPSGDWIGIAAARVEILDKPIVTWELATRPGQDVRLLADNQFYGFGVDGGTGGLFDAQAADLALIQGYDENFYALLLDTGSTELTDDSSDVNVIVFVSAVGDGTYPSWIGRTATGEIACFVVDMELLRDARPLGPRTERRPAAGG
jgi:hypothetical protein